MKILGKIENINEAYEIARLIDYENTLKSSYTRGRLEKWFRNGAILGTGKIFKCEEPHERLIKLGDKFLPRWDSLLCCTGKTDIGLHRDSSEFYGETLMLNLGEAIFTIDNEKHRLTEGMVLLFDSKRLHGATQISEIRYHFTWRRLKNQQLSLF